MQQAVFISFDLGVRGDYEGIYAWLDEHDAVECGDSLAWLKQYDFEGDLIQSLLKDITEAVETTSKTRIYVIWKDLAKGTLKGKFIVGGRKSAPWAGYRGGTEQAVPDES